MANQNNEQCFCQSYYDDNLILRDCSCGKCGFSKQEIRKLEQEIRKLELEASVPTLEDQREQLEADIKEVKEILYKLELKLVKLR